VSPFFRTGSPVSTGGKAPIANQHRLLPPREATMSPLSSLLLLRT
jgi:hypothetical protein